MRYQFRVALIPAIFCVLWLVPTVGIAIDAEQAKADAQNTADKLQDAPANLPSGINSGQKVMMPATQRFPGVPVSDTITNRANQGRLQIDPDLAQSLVKSVCALHDQTHTDVPFAASLNLPPPPYDKVYGTKSGTRHFGIVGDDCGYLGNPNAPAVRMTTVHLMDNDYSYVALFNARGDVLAFLHHTGPAQYIPVDLEHGRTPEIEAIYADLKSETQSWSTAVARLLQSQTERERTLAQGGGSH